MAHIHGKQEKLVTRGLVYAVDGIDHGTFPGNGSSSTTYGALAGGAAATLQNDTTYRYHKNGILTLDKDNTDYYSVALDLSSTSTVSVGMWARFREWTSSTSVLLEYSDNMNLTDDGFQVFASAANSYGIGLVHKGNAGENRSDFNKSLADDGRWHYLVFIFDKTESTNECSLFVDGAQATATSNPTTNNNSNSFGNESLHIGGRKPTSGNTAIYPWTIDLGPLHVYKVTLSAAEVTQNFNLWKSRFHSSATAVSTSGSIVHLDPDNSTSYGGSGATFTDLSGNDNDGTISGATYVTSTSASAFTFDGSNDTLELPNWDTLATDEITMNIWFKTTGTSQYYLFGGRRDGHTASSHLSVGINLDVGSTYTGYINGIVRNAANSTHNFTRYMSNSGITDGEWHCLHYAVKNNSQALYVDAVELATSSNSYAASVANSLPFHIASFDGTDKYFDGEVGQVQLVSRFLTAKEVKADYNALAPRYLPGFETGQTDAGASIVTSNLVAHYDFGSPICNPGSGTTITDLLHGNSGTISGATYKKNNGGVIEFDGSNNYVEVSNSSVFDPGTGDFSVGLWFKPDATNVTWNYVISSGNLNSITAGWSIGIETNTLVYKCNAGGGYSNRASTIKSTFTSTDWNYATLVIDRSNNIIKGYLNGSDSDFVSGGGGPSSNSISGFGTIASGENLRFGDTDPTQNNYFFNGQMASCEIYQGKALTAAEVLQNYNATKSRFGL